MLKFARLSGEAVLGLDKGVEGQPKVVECGLPLHGAADGRADQR